MQTFCFTYFDSKYYLHYEHEIHAIEKAGVITWAQSKKLFDKIDTQIEYITKNMLPKVNRVEKADKEKSAEAEVCETDSCLTDETFTDDSESTLPDYSDNATASIEYSSTASRVKQKPIFNPSGFFKLTPASESNSFPLTLTTPKYLNRG